jgi:hypothetical protein
MGAIHPGTATAPGLQSERDAHLSTYPACVDICVTQRMIATLPAEHRASASTLLPSDLVRVSALLLLARLVRGAVYAVSWCISLTASDAGLRHSALASFN